MSAIALVGSTTFLFGKATLDRIIMPLLAFAAGSLLGGAFFHMLPAPVELGEQELVARDRALVPPDAFDVRPDARSFTFEPCSQLVQRLCVFL
jgi:hypothetical protein